MKRKINILPLIAVLVLTLLMSIVLVACGGDDEKTWKVTFDYNYTGAPAATVVNVDDGKTVGEPTTAPTRSGYEFTGWFTDPACTADSKFVFTTVISADKTLYAGWEIEEEDGPGPEPEPGAANVRINFASELTAYEGTWIVTKVYAGGDTYDAAENAINIEIEKEFLRAPVNETDYVYNNAYNLNSVMTFGLPAINEALAEVSVADSKYTGFSAWSDFSMGEAAAHNGDFKQPGPAIMDFGNDMRNNGLFLDKVADGISADLDTGNRRLILAMNDDGQLLLGYDRVVSWPTPDATVDWEYCLVFDKSE